MLDEVISLGWGVLSLSKEKAEKLINDIIQKSEIRKKDSHYLFKALVERGSKERAIFKENMKTTIIRLLEKGIFVTKNELAQMENRVKKMEELLKEISSQKEQNYSGEGNEKGL